MLIVVAEESAAALTRAAALLAHCHQWISIVSVTSCRQRAFAFLDGYVAPQLQEAIAALRPEAIAGRCLVTAVADTLLAAKRQQHVKINMTSYGTMKTKLNITVKGE